MKLYCTNHPSCGIHGCSAMVTLACCGCLLLFLPTIISAELNNGDIRLIGGSYPWEGRVEIYFSGTWGTISDSDWTSDDAQVVCRKLGYFKPGATGQTGAYFGSGSNPIHLDYVVCSGAEYALTDCQTGNNTRQSSYSEDVGVKCATIDSSYREGDIRLVGGDYNWDGRVEIFYSGTWSTISDISWSSSDATVVCRQLRHSTEGAVPRCCGYYGEGSGEISVQSIACSGSEANVTSCLYSTSIVYDHQSDVGVQCKQGEIYNEGDIRLVGGSYSWEGRVEIYLHGEWGTITDDAADLQDAHVVCRQLGYDTRYSFSDVDRCCAVFGEGSGPIHMSFLDCSGTEYKLLDCGFENSTDQHDEDWSITCNNDGPIPGEVRLYYTYTYPSYFFGVVEVFLEGEWGTVANDGSWSIEDGEVVCNELGFEIPSSAITLAAIYSPTFRETTPTHMSDVQCSGNESSLTECPHSPGGNGTFATLNCEMKSEMEGRVEVCTSYSRWGTVCIKQWTPSHTRVVCRSLGYSDTEGTGSYEQTFDGPVIPILMDYVNCSGSEVRLWNCPHFTHSYSGCSHSDDAGVQCQPVQCDDGDIRLLTGEIQGPVEVCVSKRWATVCPFGWSDVEASVVCRQIGFRSGSVYYSGVYIRRSLQISQVSCSDTDIRLSDCDYTTFKHVYCSKDDTGVICNLDDCIDGEVRLMEGESEWEGRVEVCFNQRWGTISSDGRTQANSHIVCNSLGYELDIGTEYSLETVANSMLVFLSNVQCSRVDITLLDCSYSRNLSSVDHSKDLVIKCMKGYLNYTVSCDDGDLKLVGGESESEGLLEVCFSQRWGTVNRDGWSSSDTQVACRQLGFETTNTSEDGHDNDVWINCDTADQSTNRQSVVTLAAALTALGMSLFTIVFLCGYILYKQKRGAHSRKSANSMNEGASVINNKMVNNSSKRLSKILPSSKFHPLTMHNNQAYEDWIKRQDNEGGLGTGSTDDEQHYDICN